MKGLTLSAAAFLALSLLARAQKPPTITQIYCGKSLKPIVLLGAPDFGATAVAPLACGTKVLVLAREGDEVAGWTKIRTQVGVEGFAPSCFVGPFRPLHTGKCNRPDPLGTLQQFEQLSDTLRGFIKSEDFSDSDWDAMSRQDAEKLAASCYFAAYSTAEKPGWIKAEVFRSVIGDRVFGKDFSRVSPDEQVRVQVWVQKLLNVLSKAFDLGYKDGTKFPCNPK